MYAFKVRKGTLGKIFYNCYRFFACGSRARCFVILYLVVNSLKKRCTDFMIFPLSLSVRVAAVCVAWTIASHVVRSLFV